ncbi:hypothetical protein PUNSTDRAFT_44410 [Punctularia strigosozonata HHB-11173 SS5]|uniref:uncharacterized protein n=1 Tax=Punctularia strigosozonata (strain HHB-11173) TaxID=741275 RepID=UPI0004417DF3|nr:uncharacterized protein PUNSTDRAFT_44410 [Punctularia strigosozonata HHB-11173 SS5]EIN08904.1 hypothetical protein PUNSTDRAFT_44410 [Punctularia strigosozonata HHB-11173 SS5]
MTGTGTGMTGGRHHAMGPTDAGTGASTMTGTRDGAVGTGGGLTGRTNNPMTGGNEFRSDGGMSGRHHGATGTDVNTGNFPPAGAMNNTNPTGHTGGGGMKNLEGKVEKALGTITGSATLKAKGIEKQQEAAAVKMQNTHLTEAERLEQQAAAHRERAVVGSAHPEQRHVGGVRPSGMNSAAPGTQMVNQPGTGGIGGNPILPGGDAAQGSAY